MNKLIIGAKYDTLKEGYPVFINTDDIRPFTVKSDSVGIPFGSLLARTTATKVYEAAQNLVAGTITTAQQIVGVAMATNVKLNPTFPGGQSSLVSYDAGQQGDNMSKGEVAVQFVGNAPIENSKVFLVTNNGDQPASTLGRVTADAAVGTETLLELPQFRFSGITDVAEGLTVLKKLY